MFLEYRETRIPAFFEESIFKKSSNEVAEFYESLNITDFSFIKSELEISTSATWNELSFKSRLYPALFPTSNSILNRTLSFKL